MSTRRKTISFFDEPTDFSLVQGGPLFQFLVRAGLLKPPIDLALRRILVISGLVWLPLLLLSALAGQAVGGPGVPFLFDVGAHVRFLVSIPLFLAADVVVHRRIRPIVQQFVERGIVGPHDRPQFENVIASAMRLRNSGLAEGLVLFLAILGGAGFGKHYISMHSATWYATPSGDQILLTAAGYWYFFVGLTVFRFLWFRWYFRLFVWYRFLWQVARRIPLRLNTLHPDRAGGLAFLSASVFAFVPILLAHTVTISGVLGGKIWHEGATLPQFKLEIAAWMVYLLLLVLAPLFFFMFRLAEAKRAGLRAYGAVASRYVDEFHRKWIEGARGKDEALLGAADIQSLADLSNSFDVVRETGLVLFERSTVLRLALVLAMPIVPLALTMIPLEELIDRALSVLF